MSAAAAGVQSRAGAPVARPLIVSGVLAAVAVLAIPVGMALPGSVIGEAVSVAWEVSLVAVAIAIHLVVAHRYGQASLAVAAVGVAAITAQIVLGLAVVAGLAEPLDNVEVGAAVYALTGAWLAAASRLLAAVGLLPTRVGAVGVAVGLVQVASYALVVLGGFPTTTDPSALSSLSAATIAGSLLSLLSVPLYAVWAIWAGLRMAGYRVAPASSAPW